jgi:hypothetical protein
MFLINAHFRPLLMPGDENTAFRPRLVGWGKGFARTGPQAHVNLYQSKILGAVPRTDPEFRESEYIASMARNSGYRVR